jgi:hypothetical protein
MSRATNQEVWNKMTSRELIEADHYAETGNFGALDALTEVYRKRQEQQEQQEEEHY